MGWVQVYSGRRWRIDLGVWNQYITWHALSQTVIAHGEVRYLARRRSPSLAIGKECDFRSTSGESRRHEYVHSPPRQSTTTNASSTQDAEIFIFPAALPVALFLQSDTGSTIRPPSRLPRNFPGSLFSTTSINCNCSTIQRRHHPSFCDSRPWNSRLSPSRLCELEHPKRKYYSVSAPVTPNTLGT